MITAFSRRRVRKELKGAFAPIPFVRGAMARAVLNEMEVEAHDSVMLFLEDLSKLSGSREPLEDALLGSLISRFFKVKRSPEAMELHGFIYSVELTVWLSVDAKSQEWHFDRLTVQTPADLRWATTIPVKELASSVTKPSRRLALTNAWAALLHNEMLNLKLMLTKVNEMHAREGKKPLYDHEVSLNTSVRDGLIKLGVSIRTTPKAENRLGNLGFSTELRAIPLR
jgi:hypothetical protein